MSKTEKIYRSLNLELIVPGRELLVKLTDEDFSEKLNELVEHVTDLYKLYEVNPKEKITIVFPTKEFVQKTEFLSRDEDKFCGIFCETIETLLISEMGRRGIDMDKLHYGIDEGKGIKYEYCHISSVEYKNLLRRFKQNWYKIVGVIPYTKIPIHRNVFYVPQKELHRFFEDKIYARYGVTQIIHIEPITQEQYKKEMKQIENRIKKYKREKFRENIEA